MINPININGLRPTPGASDRSAQDAASAPVSASGDAAEFSPAAVGRSEIARLLEISDGSPDIRAERVEQARQDLADGLHRVQQIVEQVAASLTKYVT